MQIAYVMAPERGAADRCLTEVAAQLGARGLRIQGVVQVNTERTDGGKCDMDVRVLPQGATHRISQSLGAGSRGCRLNPAGLEQAVAEVEAGFDPAADMLIVNKFGKHEAEGRGFRPVIARAVADGMPCLIGVNRLNLELFQEFTGGDALALPCDVAAVLDWAAARQAARAEG